MQTPYPPPMDRLHVVRVGMALLLTGSTLLLAISVALRLYAIGEANEQFRIAQQEQAVLNRLISFKAEEEYQTCQREAAQVPRESSVHDEALQLGEECQRAEVAATFQQSQILANAGRLTDAITKVQTITDSAAALQVQQWVLAWSNQILQTAEDYYLDPSGRLPEAIHTAGEIPSSSVLYSQAQAKIRDWQTDWAVHQNYWQKAQMALAAQRPRVALAQIQQMTHPYWRQQAMPLLEAVYQKWPEPQSLEEPSSDKPPATNPAEELPLGAYAQLLLPVGLILLLAQLSLGRSSA